MMLLLATIAVAEAHVRCSPYTGQDLDPKSSTDFVEACEVFEAAVLDEPLITGTAPVGWPSIPELGCPAGKACNAGAYPAVVAAVAAQSRAQAFDALVADPSLNIHVPTIKSVETELSEAIARRRCHQQYTFTIGSLPETFRTPLTETVTRASHCLANDGAWMRFNAGGVDSNAAWMVFLAALRTGSSPVVAWMVRADTGAAWEVTILGINVWFADPTAETNFDQCIGQIIQRVDTTACKLLAPASVKFPTRVTYVQGGEILTWEPSADHANPWQFTEVNGIIDPYRLLLPDEGSTVIPSTSNKYRRLATRSLNSIYRVATGLVRDEKISIFTP